VLKGAFLFLADLMRHLESNCEVDFMAVASYGSSTESSGVVRILKDLDHEIQGRDVLIVEDIVDSGLTLSYLMKNLRTRKPASIEVCALMQKTDVQQVPLDIKYRADLAVLDGSCEEAVSLYIESLRADPHSPRVIGWLLAQHARSQSTHIANYFKQGEVAERTFEILEAAIRSSPLRASLWRQKGVLHQILGQAEEAGRCFERSAALREAAQRESSPVGRVLAAAVYHLVGKPKGLIHEVWAERKPAGPGRGGFLEEILGSLTQEMTQAVRNTFLSVREYARAKWPQQTHDILDYNYTYKVTKEDEPSGGLSAGLPSALAFLSVFLDRPVPQNIASSGVLVADSHDVLSVRPVGEPEYKVRGAYNRNLQRLILPVGNRKDLKNNPRVPAEVCEEIVRYASDLDDAVVLTFGEDIWIR